MKEESQDNTIVLPKSPQSNDSLNIVLPKSHHHWSFPKDGYIMSAIIGRTGSGKSTLLTSLLLDGYLNYEKFYLIARDESFESESYKILKEKCGDKGNFIELDENENQGGIPSPEQIEKVNGRIIMIFDDVITLSKKEQRIIGRYFCSGRHRFDCFYLAQDYTEIPLRTIRRQLNMLICFRLNDFSLVTKRIRDDFSNDLSLKEFRNLYLKYVENNDDYGFITIIKGKHFNKQNVKYRNKLLGFILYKDKI